MKTLFIPSKLTSPINKAKILEISKKLPKDLAIAYSIQYETQAREIKDLLSKKHKITSFTQVLGCSQPEFNSDAILLVSDGRFHAISLAHETKLPVYLLEKFKLHKISGKEVRNLEKSKKGAYMKFLNSNKVGILISSKPGQQNLKRAINIKKNLKTKSSYLFICNNINTSEFENFPEIQSWVNTACRRLDMNDARIVNIGEVKLIS